VVGGGGDQSRARDSDRLVPTFGIIDDELQPSEFWYLLIEDSEFYRFYLLAGFKLQRIWRNPEGDKFSLNESP
jgi:hypothetical protein